ncbi:MAG: sugar phosphate nucleotidyltransferase [Pseudobdellovibrionaceae bacterium]
MKAMLLAAGEGQRLRPLTEFVPKPALPFLNIPLAYYSTELLLSIGIKDFVVNTYHLSSVIRSTFESQRSKFQGLNFSDEKSLMGSGGGIGEARNHLAGSGDFFVMNADEVIFPHDIDFLIKMRGQHQKSGAIATLMVKDHPGVGKEFGGVWAQSNYEVDMFSKINPGKSHLKGWHFIGPMILSDRVFKYIPQGQVSNIFYDCLTHAMNDGEKVIAFKTECDWFETGNSQDFLSATEACLKSNSAPLKNFIYSMWSRYAPEMQLFKTNEAIVLAEKLPVGSSTKGFVVLGRNCEIPSGSVLENCIIANGMSFSSKKEIKNQIIVDSSQL